MPHRVLRAVLLDVLAPCCGPEDAGALADRLIALGLRLPTLTVTNVDELDQIPDGSAVVVGNLAAPGSRPVVGVKQQHAITFVGDGQPWPFHDPKLAPPLPCTVVWMPAEQVEMLRAKIGETA